MSTRPVALVAAVAENGVIGANGGLPWRVKADMRKFRAVTMGKPVIMGRKTFESIGRVLDGRDVIVVTRQRDFTPAGVFVASSLKEALSLADEKAALRGADEICVVGGGEIYRETLPLAARLYLTRVQASPVGDTHFPNFPAHDWREISREDLAASDGDTAVATTVVYEKRR